MYFPSSSPSFPPFLPSSSLPFHHHLVPFHFIFKHSSPTNHLLSSKVRLILGYQLSQASPSTFRRHWTIADSSSAQELPARPCWPFQLTEQHTHTITNMTEPLSKVDSAVQGLSSSPPKEKGHRRASSSAAGVMNINDLGKASYQCTQWLVALLPRVAGRYAITRH